MDTKVLVVFAIALIAVIFLVTLLLLRKRKSDRLRGRFGPEYDRILKERGGPKVAEAVLEQRERRVERFGVRSLSREERDKYSQEWAAVQRQFVDDPSFAVTEADRMVTAVMAARGYPMADFEQRAADISVNYPGVVQNYRSARAIVQGRGAGRGTTEDLRQAMVYYRSLFEELLELPNKELPNKELPSNEVPNNVESPRNENIGVSHERAS